MAADVSSLHPPALAQEFEGRVFAEPRLLSRLVNALDLLVHLAQERLVSSLPLMTGLHGYEFYVTRAQPTRTSPARSSPRGRPSSSARAVAASRFAGIAASTRARRDSHGGRRSLSRRRNGRASGRRRGRTSPAP